MSLGGSRIARSAEAISRFVVPHIADAGYTLSPQFSIGRSMSTSLVGLRRHGHLAGHGVLEAGPEALLVDGEYHPDFLGA